MANLARNRKFESISLRQPVRLASQLRGLQAKGPALRGGMRVADRLSEGLDRDQKTRPRYALDAAMRLLVERLAPWSGAGRLQDGGR